MDKDWKQPFIYGRFDEQEAKDIEAYSVFMETFPRNYIITAKTSPECYIDIFSSNRTGGTIGTELKARDKYTERFDTLMIEPMKLAHLEYLWDEKRIATYYVNLVEGINKMYIFCIPAISHLADTFKKVEQQKIWCKKDRRYKYEDRYLLPKELAYVFEWDDEYYKIKKPKNNIAFDPPKRYDVDWNQEITCRYIEELK